MSTASQDAQLLAETFLDMIEEAQPRLTGRIRISAHATEKLFRVEPHGAGAKLSLGRQTFRRGSTQYVVSEAVLACEALIYGLTTAAAMQLDDSARWYYEQMRAPCSE